eukprot:1180620-Rhodomonas_salina.1
MGARAVCLASADELQSSTAGDPNRKRAARPNPDRGSHAVPDSLRHEGCPDVCPQSTIPSENVRITHLHFWVRHGFGWVGHISAHKEHRSDGRP